MGATADASRRNNPSPLACFLVALSSSVALLLRAKHLLSEASGGSWLALIIVEAVNHAAI